MIRHDETYYKERKPKPDLGVLKNFKRWIWDSRRKAFFGRNKREWLQLIIFYLCFFGTLILIAGSQLYLTYSYVISFDKPVYEYSQISTRAWLKPNRKSMFEMSSLNIYGPGIVMKPNIVPNANPPIILIDESHKPNKMQKYVTAVKTMLSEYDDNPSKFNKSCDDNLIPNKYTNRSCFYDIKSLGDCSIEPYGYTSPPKICVYLRINKRFGWIPFIYSQGFYLPEEMPEWLQQTIRKSDKFQVWVSCEGVTKDDTELMGEIEYLPTPGFPAQYFPFINQANYQVPVIALRFKNLTVNRLINIECKTWARNIDNEDRYNLKFRILVKTNDTNIVK